MNPRTQKLVLIVALSTLVALLIFALLWDQQRAPTPQPGPDPQIPAAPLNSVAVELGNGNEVDITRRTDNTNTRIAITVNAQDQVTVIRPVTMHMGLPADASTLPPTFAGTGEFKVRPTLEQAPQSTGGAFRTVCLFAHALYDDSITAPGERGRAHLHTFVGNSDSTGESTPESIRSSGNSTCRGGIANRSSYWIPALLDMRTNPGKAIPFVPEFSVYYKGGNFSETQAAGSFQPPIVFEDHLPVGLRMIAGWPNATTAPPGGLEFAMRWSCPDSSDRQYGPVIPNCKTGRLLMEVMFPQCWDGKNLDSPDHKSHMSYGISVKNVGDSRGWFHRECPTTHPKVIPAISFNVHWALTPEQWGNVRLVSDVNLKNPAGWTAHGDWFNGWDPSISDAWIRGCIKAKKDCHAHLLGDGRMLYGP